MEIAKKIEINDVLVLKSPKHLDERGWFQETYHLDKISSNNIDLSFVQDNLVYSKKNVLRGLHFQDDNGQGKMVSCIKGRIFDVFVDLRKDSSSYKKWGGIELSEDDNSFVYIPPGFAHGYYTIEEENLVHYKCTKHYAPSNEIGIIWNDSDINIDWPFSENVILSEKDRKNKTIKELNL